MHLLVLSLVCHTFSGALKLEKRLLKGASNCTVRVFSSAHFLLNRRLKVREVLIDALLDDGETLLTRTSLLFDVALKELFLLPDGIRGTLNHFFARLGNVRKPFLEKLLSLGDLLLPLVELLGLVLPLSVEEVNDVG